MLISVNHLLPRHALSKDPSRPLLGMIDVRSEKDKVVAVATNGYSLIEVRDITPPDDEFPESDIGISVSGIRISGASAQKMKSTMKPQSGLPILAFGKATSKGVVTSNLEQTTVYRDRQVEGNFPDYSHLIPDISSAEKIVRVDPRLLAETLKAFERFSSIDLVLHEGSLSPVLLYGHQDDLDVTGVVMPLRS